MLRLITRLRRLRAPRAPFNPFATVQGVFDVLEANAAARNDTRAVGALRDARATVVREAIKSIPSA